MTTTTEETAVRAENDPGLFGPESVTWRIHGDPSMLVAGYRALLLQAVHPLVMAGFDDNTVFQDDPWGRLRRTGEWLATVTYGTTGDAEQAGEALRTIHARLEPGIEPESGRTYRVDDPELLRWVHTTEVESFLTTYRRCGGRLAPGEGDAYVDEMRTSARLVGLDPETVPGTEADIADYYASIRRELRLTRVARRNVARGFVPPMPRWVRLATPARPAWAGLMMLSLAMLPPWTRRLYGLPGLPTTDLVAGIDARLLRRAILLTPWSQSPAHARALDRMAGEPADAT